MYTDVILFIVGGVCAILAAICVAYLIISRKHSRVYREVLQQETEFFDALTTTALLTKKSNQSESNSEKGTDSLKQEKSAKRKGTSLLIDDDSTEILRKDDTATIDFDASALEGRYIIRNEIHGGGMSRVFIADSAKLGNQWIVKYIPNQIGELANEENILKLLNHISLPKIIDIFRDEKGVYLVESFIEGISLDKVLESGQKINQVIILDWAEQLAQVLNYLHRMEPHPIYHYDLKPSNIMVTHDNKLVLIDFGISKRYGEDEAAAIGVTYQYAAPEQLKHKIAPKHMSIVESRFGELPAERIHWNPDARTDIYSLGVIMFEFATGSIPTLQNTDALREVVSYELLSIIEKCLSVNPNNRYQSAVDLLADLQKLKGSKIKMARTLFMRKFASISAVFAIVFSGGSLSGGYYIYGQENAALLDVRPEIVTISLQQSSDLSVLKRMPNGSVIALENSQIRWTHSNDTIARVDGNRISGLNLGETELLGRYRNKPISLTVRVVQPMDNIVDISQRYQQGHIAKVFAGTMEREHNDGILSKAEFVSPESVAVAEDGTIYIADAGLLRRIKDNQVDSINFEPDFLTPRIVRCYKDEVYVLTNEWEDEDGIYYGIIKLAEDGAEGLYIADAKYTAVEDFVFSSDGLIYFIDRNAGVGGVFLKSLNPIDVEDIQTICELPIGTSALTIDGKGNIYLANPETGTILIWRNNTLSFFAGVENEKAFIDGSAPLFYMPQRLEYADNYLFVWDFNVLRRISIEGDIAGECITVVGEANPTFDLEILLTTHQAEEIVLPNSKLMDFAVKGKGVLLTDPKRGVVWWVE